MTHYTWDNLRVQKLRDGHYTWDNQRVQKLRDGHYTWDNLRVQKLTGGHCQSQAKAAVFANTMGELG